MGIEHRCDSEQEKEMRPDRRNLGNSEDWIRSHPGGPFLCCQAGLVRRSKSRREHPTRISRNEAHDHFQRTLAGSAWSVLRGWHMLRHSFASNCAAQGIDQRLIDEWLGHTTEEMRRRYRYLIPSSERQAIRSVFGDPPAGCPATP
jgi:integrase